MDSNKVCKNCGCYKELVCCDKCMNELIVGRISESIQGDFVSRFKFMIDNKFEELEEQLKIYLKDKQIVCIKRGNKLKIV